MGTQTQKEKKRIKKSDIQNEIEDLKKEIEDAEIKSEVKEDSKSKIITVEDTAIKEEDKIGYLAEMYSWCINHQKYPWMFWVPKKEADKKNWLNEWADFALQWFRINKIHIISFTELMGNKPFLFLQDKSNAIRLIIDRLVSQKYCYYMNKKETVIRVMWRTLEEWVNIIFDWAFRKGRIEFTVFEIISLQESIDNFHKLPIEDLKKIFSMMVIKLKARWISEKNYHIELII